MYSCQSVKRTKISFVKEIEDKNECLMKKGRPKEKFTHLMVRKTKNKYLICAMKKLCVL